MTDTAGPLQSLLGTTPPASVLALGDAARDELAAIISDSRRRQTQSLNAAFEAALKHVPFPARAIVKRVLGG